MATVELENESCHASRCWGKDLSLIGLSLTLLFFGLVIIAPFAFPDLNQYVAIPYQMVTSNNWLAVYFEKVPNLSDAPLFYWMQAAAISWFGFNIFALKFWSAVFAILGCVAVYPLTRHYFGRRAALICSFITATTPIFFTYCHAIAPYMVASVIFSLTFIVYFYAWQTKGIRHFVWKVLFWILLAFSGLAIGLSGIILPLLILSVHNLMFKGIKFFRPMCSIVGVLCFCLIFGGWLYIGYCQMPNFVSNYLFHTSVFALLDTGYPFHKLLLIIPLVFLAFLPWSVFFINSLRISFPSSWKNRYEVESSFFFVTWIVAVLIGLGVTVSPLARLLTVSVPINILISRYFSLLWDKKNTQTTGPCYDVLLYTILIIAVALLGFLYLNWFHVITTNLPYLRTLTIVLLVTALIVIPIMRHQSFAAGFFALFVANLVCSILLSHSYQYLSTPPKNAPALLQKYNLTLERIIKFKTPGAVDESPVKLGS